MLTVSRMAASLLLLFSVFNTPIHAQERPPESRSAPIVTATVRAGRIRFTAPSNTTAMRLEVYAEDGQRLFDSGFKQGTLLDWAALDQQGQRYPAGSYLCVVAVKSLSGRVSQKLGMLSISSEGAAALAPAETGQLSAAQRQALSGAEHSSALTVLREGEATAVTSLANTGTEGEITRGKGALSFRLGDFHSGNDVEQMRLTEEGNLGIGTADPQARLDVNGVIRAQEGIQFNDGTLLSLSPKGGLEVTWPGGETSSFDATTNNLSGTGTQNRLAKWTDNAGTLGDSKIFENANGNVGIGTDTPGNKLTVVGSVELGAMNGVGVNPSITNPSRTAGFAQVQFYPASGTNVAQSFAVVPRGTGQPNNRAQFSIFNTDFIADSTNHEFLTVRSRGQDFVVGTGKVGAGVIRPIIFSAGLMTDNVTNNNQLVLATDGSVGVGTNAPTQKLEVNGSIKLGGQGNGIVFPDGTRQTTAGGAGNYIQNTTVKQENSSFNISGNGTAGGTLSGNVVNATTQFNLGGNRILSNQPGGNSNLFIGFNSPSDNAAYYRQGATFVGSPGSNMQGDNHTVVGSNAGTLKTWNGHPTLGYGITLIGAGANADPYGSFSYTGSATAIGARAFVSQADSLVLGSINGVNGATSDTRVGIGTHAPQFKLHVVDPSNAGLRVQTDTSGGTVASFGGLGEFQVDAPGAAGGRFVIKENGFVGIGWAHPSSRLDVNGIISFSQLGAAGSTALCLNNSNQISSCSSSLRYKTNVADFFGGLSLINRLRPVTFDWKESKAHDLGLVAEEVAEVEPLLVLHDRKGEIEGVKYDRLNVVLINAIKEQQAQIKSQAEALAALQKENLEMKRRLASLEQSRR
jgi:hypothetical protein